MLKAGLKSKMHVFIAIQKCTFQVTGPMLPIL